MTTYGSPHPNWYPDPATPGLWRYWNGAHWTEHTAPMTGATSSGPAGAPTGISTGPSEALHWLLPVGRSSESIAAGYLGLLCLVLALVAILPFAFIGVLPLAGLTVWLAIRALGKAGSGGHGSGRAIFGLVGAGLAVVGSVIGVFGTVTVSGT